MRKIIKENLPFLVPACSVLAVSSICIFLFIKAEIHLFLNALNSPFLDGFFKTLTHVGSGFFAASIALLLFFKKIRSGLTVLMTFLASGLIVQTLKQFVFTDSLRPLPYFFSKAELHLIEGVKVFSIRSFPSGHATTAFGLFFCLAAFVKNKFLKFLFFLMAALVAYSRVYLSQHFLLDVTAGAVLGTVTALLVLLWTQSWKAKWLERPLLRLG